MSALEQAREMFSGRRVGVVGLAREGLALSRFLLSVGAEVVATDDRPLEALSPEARILAQGDITVLAGGLAEAVLEASYLFVSPGVPLELPLLGRARAAGLPLWNEPGLLLALCPAATFGVTGSSGKSTTASLAAAILREDDGRAYLGGNIGQPLIEKVGGMAPGDRVVLELSSFQLELVRHSPRYALVTNITPNHLDRHATMDAYVEAKRGIYCHQQRDDLLVLNADDEWSERLATEAPGQVAWFSTGSEVAQGACLDGDEVVLCAGAARERVCRTGDLRLRGEHNVANVLAAAALTHAAGVRTEAIRAAVTSFAGLAHRLELVAAVEGVTYVNDSIATTPERSAAGLRAIETPIILLAGGRDKHLPWEGWIEEARQRAKSVVVFGEVGRMLVRRLAEAGVAVSAAGTMREAVNLARELAGPGDTVLLSPGGTSFDEFRDFEERGNRFRDWVLSMGRRT